ncbi:MAG: ECF transporter S component [Clostridia bacterium]|nr:ECF transporter S component [Clostridia bacterium]
MRKKTMQNTVLSAMFMCLGLTLPFLTGQIEFLGEALLPMHLPIILCGIICGWKYGLVVGFATPLLRMYIFGMPQMPDALSMAFELATYATVAGSLYYLWGKRNIFGLFGSLTVAIIVGRIVRVIVKAFVVGMGFKAFSYQVFVVDGFLYGLPGIITQFILIPVIVRTFNK